MPFVVSFIGRSGSGKTTLITRLLSQFSKAGIQTGSIKNTHHHVSFDKPGKDSWNHRKAGANRTLAVSHDEFALFGKKEEGQSLAQLVNDFFSGYPLVIVEGFKQEDCNLRIEVHREEIIEQPLYQTESMEIHAIITDYPIQSLNSLKFDIDETEVISNWILKQADLT